VKENAERLECERSESWNPSNSSNASNPSNASEASIERMRGRIPNAKNPSVASRLVGLGDDGDLQQTMEGLRGIFVSA
jgi:hypothetical protein